MPIFSIVFFGTDAIAAPLLSALKADARYRILSVVTRPDQPAGRKLELTPSPVKTLAERLQLPVLQPKKLDVAFLATLKGLQVDVFVVMAYGKLFPQAFLDLPPRGAFNVHASLLPRHRGASPIAHALLSGDSVTGISLMQMTAALDAGPVFSVFPFPIQKTEDAVSLRETLGNQAALHIPNALLAALQGAIQAAPQDDSKATFCGKISKKDGILRFDEPALLLETKIRAYAGWPKTHAFWGKERLVILRGAAHADSPHLPAGTVFALQDKIFVATGSGSLELIQIQKEGKKPMAIADFMKGAPHFIGSILTSEPV